MLWNGERQVAPDLSGIRRDHVARYEWAAKTLPSGSRVLDIACGVGYGAKILADAGHVVTAVDASAEAIAYSRAHYGHRGILFVTDRAETFDTTDRFDAIVCFETIEHLVHPGPVLNRWCKWAPRLIASVPNESVFPHGGRVRFHHRHYTRAEFSELLAGSGWKPAEWYGQAGPHSEVEKEIEGRTLIMTATATSAPKHVSIVGLGPSALTYFELVRGLGGRTAYCDEVWAINALGRVIDCDRIFHMDDMAVQERRAEARPDSNIAAMVAWLRNHPGPIYTSIVRPGYAGMVAFPLEDVLNGGYDGSNGGAPYFNNTAAYAIAYAVHIGVERMSLFGVDFTRPNAHHAEQGRGCCEFWLGIAAARGIEITVPDTSSLLDAMAPHGERLYGYDGADVIFHTRNDGKLQLEFRNKEIPTAGEIERRYDHRRHPNRLVEGKP